MEESRPQHRWSLVVNLIAEGESLVLDHFDEMVLQCWQLQGLSLKNNAIPLLPNQVAQGSKRKMGDTMEKILTR